MRSGQGSRCHTAASVDSVVLKVDTSEPLLRPTQLTALVEAVRNAADHDEDTWIEWKSGYDNNGVVSLHRCK